MASITCIVDVRTGQYLLPPGLPLDTALRDALSSKADLSNLRCFRSNAAVAPIRAFEEWVLQHAPHVEALQLPKSEAQLGKLQHLKHLEMQAHVFVHEVSKAAEQLPGLETLYLQARRLVDRTVDVIGCKRLRHLVVQGRFAHALPVRHEAKCQVAVHVSGFCLKQLYSTDQASWRDVPEATPDLVLLAEKPSSCRRLPEDSGMCARFARAGTLTVNWPANWLKGTGKPDTNCAVESAQDLLRSFTPANGQSLRSLKRLIIVAEGAIKCCIPGGLPKLEELVLFAGGRAEVSFEDPPATLSAVKTLYIFGQPLLDMGTHDLRSANEKAANRDLLLSTVSPRKARRKNLCCRSCMYLRPVGASELSFEDAHDRVSRLARQCRCGACFDCLRRAGCLTCS